MSLSLEDRYTISLPSLRAEVSHNCDLLHVDQGSRSHMAIVDRFGRYLQREEGYDFPLSMGEERCRGYLFLNPDGWTYTTVKPVGAAVFSFHNTQWWFDWVWMHPYARRRGLLTSCLPDFEKDLGKFGFHGPYSEAMRAFLLKRGKCIECWEPSSHLRCENCKSTDAQKEAS